MPGCWEDCFRTLCLVSKERTRKPDPRISVQWNRRSQRILSILQGNGSVLLKKADHLSKETNTLCCLWGGGYVEEFLNATQRSDHFKKPTLFWSLKFWDHFTRQPTQLIFWAGRGGGACQKQVWSSKRGVPRGGCPTANSKEL